MIDGIGEPFAEMPAKRPYHTIDYGIDWTAFLAKHWQQGTSYAANDRVRPRTPTGFEYEATTAGQSAAREPRWPTTLADTVADGSVIWTARALSTASLRTTVSTSSWTADSGVTLSGAVVDGQLATTLVAGGTSGNRYSVLNRVTFANGQRAEGELVIPVRD